MASLLAADGHAVDTATDGIDALAKLRDGTYDVVFSDVRMPRLDGPRLYREAATAPDRR